MVEIPIRTHEIELSFQRRRTLVLPPQIQSIEDEMSIEFPQILLTCFKFLIVHQLVGGLEHCLFFHRLGMA